EGFASDIARLRQDLTIAEAQLRDYQSRLGAAFPHEAYCGALTTLRDQLKYRLAGATTNDVTESLPDLSALAEQIKVLTSAHTIETPQRVGTRTGSAAEPITERIRQRMEAAPSM